ncbi:MAG: ROK family protein [Candidatus Diapherotrites archaeon]|nr:ROK family protein [Candidatus Diapherotrites archaeon]
MPVVECLDVGGTHTRYALIENEKVLVKERVETRCENAQGLLDFIQEVCVRNRSRAGVSGVNVSCAVLPGPVRKGVLLNAPPLGLQYPLDFSCLEGVLGNAVIIENDLNAAVRTELEKGVGRTVDSFYLLALSTGIGAGIVLNGKAVKGLAGEFGHCVLDASSNAFLCACTRRGCWSAYSSGKGLEMQARANGFEWSASGVFDHALNGHEIACEIVKRARAFNARGLGVMVNALEVQAIVVMGSLGLNRFKEVVPLPGEVGCFTVNPVPRIVKTALADDLGWEGAYFLGMDFLDR